MLSGHKVFAGQVFWLVLKNILSLPISKITGVATVVDWSTTTGQNRHQLVRSPDESTLVNFYKWSAHLNCFKPIPNITTSTISV